MCTRFREYAVFKRMVTRESPCIYSIRKTATSDDPM